MNDYLFYYCGQFVPPALKIPLVRLYDYTRYKLRLEIINYLESELQQNPDDEKEEVLKFLRKNPLEMIPYKYASVPPSYKIVVYDDGEGNKYVLYDGKKIFFPNDWSVYQIKMVYTSLLREQQVKSPHRYETDSICVRDGDIIADCGAAEGIWALSSVEKAGKIYLFECEENWIAALKKTFEPWKDKVEIVNKFVSDTNSGNNITIDEFFSNRGGGGDKFHKSGHRRRGSSHAARLGKNFSFGKRFTAVRLYLSSAKRRVRTGSHP
ncbi:MAG: hypothetical protein LBB22_03630 [Treponema sp.]|jgi:hypothetical protein|nr:hypothetical protein [Treponema sp.]